jgi:DNA-binding MarR family transcriptional regulator
MGKKSKGKGKKKQRQKTTLLAAEALTMDAADDGRDLGRAGPDGETALLETRRHTVGPTELAARLASLSTILQRHLARVDAGDGLTRARLSALSLLVLGGPRTLGELAHAEQVRPPTMTRLVHAMEADGLVVRERNPDDGRSIIIRATTRGEAQLELGRSRQVAPLAEAITDLDRGERRQLEDATDLLGRVLRDPPRESGAAE